MGEGFRASRLNSLGRYNGAGGYLEIGVHKGDTFRQVQIRSKVGVDPKFAYDSESENDEFTHHHEMTSDEFFVSAAQNYRPFDLIYLDGLHTFEQTFRDFCSTLSVAHKRTIWLLDDTMPTGPIAALPDPRRVNNLRNIMQDDSRAWMGDVFKVVLAIHDFFPQISYATYSGHGQTILWQQARADFAPRWNSLAAISSLDYLDLVENVELMRITDHPEGEIQLQQP